MDSCSAWARALGIKTLLKPHLWVRHGAWPGDIAMGTGDAWKAWFASYEAFILHYARLAEANGFEALAVGTEMAKASARTEDWKRIIARVREVYVFGSYARGALEPGDLDLLVVHDRATPEY